MITSQAIHRPVGRDDVRIVVATANRLSIALLPTRPGGPVQRRIVLKSRHVRRRVIEQTFTHAILVWAVAILQAAHRTLSMNCSYFSISSFLGWPNSFMTAASQEPEPPSSPRPAIHA